MPDALDLRGREALLAMAENAERLKLHGIAERMRTVLPEIEAAERVRIADELDTFGWSVESLRAFQARLRGGDHG